MLVYDHTAWLKHVQCIQHIPTNNFFTKCGNSVNTAGVVILLILRNQRACIRSKDWRCRARVTPARSPWRAHVTCIPRLRQRKSFSRMLLSQKSKTSRITSPNSNKNLNSAKLIRLWAINQPIFVDGLRKKDWRCRKRPSVVLCGTRGARQGNVAF